jgi:hypothetical protein
MVGWAEANATQALDLAGSFYLSHRMSARNHGSAPEDVGDFDSVRRTESFNPEPAATAGARCVRLPLMASTLPTNRTGWSSPTGLDGRRPQEPSPFALVVWTSSLATNGPWSYRCRVAAQCRTVSTLVAGATRPVLHTRTGPPWLRVKRPAYARSTHPDSRANLHPVLDFLRVPACRKLRTRSFPDGRMGKRWRNARRQVATLGDRRQASRVDDSDSIIPQII